MYSRILVPIDTSYESDYWLKAPLKAACEMAKKSQASMLAMSVVPRKLFAWYYPDVTDVIDKTKERLETIVGEYCPRDINVEVNVEQGAICPEILRVARQQSIDVIVMASHGPRAKDYLIGSNASHIALHAPCSVFVVRGES